MSHKKFSKSLYKKYDAKARELAKSCLVDFEDNPNQFGIDLINHKTNEAVDVEIKVGWQKWDFPFTSVDVTDRKVESMKKHKAQFPDHNVCLIQFCANSRNFLILELDTILNHQKITKDTIYTKQEAFYRIPLNCVIFKNVAEEQKKKRDYQQQVKKLNKENN